MSAITTLVKTDSVEPHPNGKNKHREHKPKSQGNWAASFPHQTIATVAIIVGLTLAVRSAEDRFLLLVVMAGALGGCIANYYRLKNIPVNDRELLERRDPWQVVFQIYSSPLTASLLAVVIYVLMLSDLLGGKLFPQFTVHASLLGSGPSDAMEKAKALLWAFIAGYSERLLPSVFERFGNSLRQ